MLNMSQPATYEASLYWPPRRARVQLMGSAQVKRPVPPLTPPRAASNPPPQDPLDALVVSDRPKTEIAKLPENIQIQEPYNRSFDIRGRLLNTIGMVWRRVGYRSGGLWESC